MDWLPITLVGLPLMLWEFARERAGRPVGAIHVRAWRTPPARIVAWAGAALVPLFAVQLKLLYLQAIVENGGATAAFARYPIPVYIGRTVNPSVHHMYSLLSLGLAIAESLCLVILWLGGRALLARSGGRAFVACVGGLLAVLAVFAPALSSTDPYEYIAAAKLGPLAYGAPGSLNILYGPVWLWGSTFILHLAQSAAMQVFALRVFNALLVAAIVWLLARARCPSELAVCFALNPGVWFHGVANPHPELWGIVCLAACLAVVRSVRQPSILAAVCLTCAGCVKAPFLLMGSGLAGIGRTLRARLSVVSIAAFATLLLSYAVGGRDFFQNYNIYARGRIALLAPPQQAERIVIEALVLGALAAGFFRGKNYRGLAWLVPQLAIVPYPWYALWGLCLLLDDASWAVAFLASLPTFAQLMDYNYDAHGLAWVLVLSLSCLGIVDARRRATKGGSLFAQTTASKITRGTFYSSEADEEVASSCDRSDDAVTNIQGPGVLRNE